MNTFNMKTKEMMMAKETMDKRMKKNKKVVEMAMKIKKGKS